MNKVARKLKYRLLRAIVRWNAFWKNFDRITAEYHDHKMAHPELYQDLNQTTL